METIGNWLRGAKKQIDSLDAELIALKNFASEKADRSWLVTHDTAKVTATQVQKADTMLQERVIGVPLAYLLGEKEFYGRKFEVCADVLIPRPETESLIDLIKKLPLPKQPKFLEIGTGSGCIAITLALEYPQSQVLATDLSAQALDVAYRNDVQHEGRVELVQSNLLRDLMPLDEHYDVLVANLPYVDPEWEWLDQHALGFEPKKALYARGNGGLSLYQRLLREICHYRNEAELWLDYLVLEADPCQHRRLIEMAQKAGFFHLKTEGFGLVFEDSWRYWWDYRSQTFVHKPEEILVKERATGAVSWAMEQL